MCTRAGRARTRTQKGYGYARSSRGQRLRRAGGCREEGAERRGAAEDGASERAATAAGRRGSRGRLQPSDGNAAGERRRAVRGGRQRGRTAGGGRGRPRGRCGRAPRGRLGLGGDAGRHVVQRRRLRHPELVRGPLRLHAAALRRRAGQADGLQNSMGELALNGNGLLLFSNSQHIHRPVWLSKSCCYWSCIRFCRTPFKFFCKHHRTSVFHLWSIICLWLLICIPAIFGHPWALFQETPWSSEWHRHCRQQLVHCVSALPLESFD